MRKQRFLLFCAAWMILSCTPGCNNSNPPMTPSSKPPGSVLPHSTNSLEEQLQAYQNEISQNPQDVKTLIQLGNAFMDAGRYQEAIDAYGKSLEITPENADVRIDMGTCYRKIGKPEMAVAAYRKALTYAPDHPNGLANLGVVLDYDLKNPKEAVVVWEKFLKLYPDHSSAASIRREVERINAAKDGTVPDNNHS
jgi:cytochrome c-type biogenesis protein CcmH/NrfG